MMGTIDPPWGWTGSVRLLIAGLIASSAALLPAIGPRAGQSGPPPEAPLAVDPNTAPPMALLALPSLGPTRVDRVVQARAEAPFASIDDLQARVSGIGPATIAAIGHHLRLDAPPEAIARPGPAPAPGDGQEIPGPPRPGSDSDLSPASTPVTLGSSGDALDPQ